MRFLCYHTWLNRFLTQAQIIYEQKETGRRVLFNDALNTFYLRLYGVRHMVKDHSDSERGNPPSPHRLLYAPSHRQDNYRLHQSWSTG